MFSTITLKNLINEKRSQIKNKINATAPRAVLIPKQSSTSNKVDQKSRSSLYKNEGLNSLYKISGFLWLLNSNKFPSLRLGKTYNLFNTAMNVFKYKIFDLHYSPDCLDYNSLINYGYLKEKHWVYSAYIGTITSLPLLYKLYNNQEILRAILAKIYFGTSMKLLDNLNDEVHDVSQAVDSLWNWLNAHIKGEYVNRNNDYDKVLTKAENSAFKIETWVFDAISSSNLYESNIYQDYINDAVKWVKGQADSVKYKPSSESSLPSIKEYIKYISEKSIGDLWIDLDLCFLTSEFNFEKAQLKSIKLLKTANSLIFKSLLFYDDVQDIYEDLRTKSINSAIILALEREIISYNDLKNKKCFQIVEKLRESRIFDDIIKLADMVFLLGTEIFSNMNYHLEGILDKGGLIQSYKLLRMFLFRKFLNINRDYKSIKLFFSSLGDFKKIKETIPNSILELQRSFL